MHDRVVQGNELDAGTLPISRHFEKDAGRYIGSGILVCKDPDTGVRNLSYQRLQLKGPNRFGASLHSRGHIWEHLQRCAARRQNLEVAIVIGVHPAINLAAGAKVAMEVDEFDVAGALLGQPGRSGQMQDHRRRGAGGGRIRAGGRNPRRRARGRRAVRRVHRLFDRPLDPQRVRREGDHLAQQADLPRHHSGLLGRASAARDAPPRRRMCTCASRRWCRTSRR